MNLVTDAVYGAFGLANGMIMGELAYEFSTYLSGEGARSRNFHKEKNGIDLRMMMTAALANLFIHGVAIATSMDDSIVVSGVEWGLAATLAFLAAKDATSEPGVENFREWCSLSNNSHAVYTASWRTLSGLATSVGANALFRALPGFLGPARPILNGVVLVGVASSKYQALKEQARPFLNREKT